MKRTRGTTRKVLASRAILFKPPTPRSRRSNAIPKLTSSSTERCDGRFFGDSHTPCSSRSAGRRSSCTPCSMALETREVGDAEGTHNEPLQRTGFAGR